MSIIQRNRLLVNNLVYTTGNYVDPPWMNSLSPSKVGNTVAQWNANKIQGQPVWTGVPQSGESLVFNGTQWSPLEVLGGNGGTGSLTTGHSTLDGTVSGVLSDTGVHLIDSFPYTSGNCIKYITKGEYSTNVQGSEILIIHDGTTAQMTEYAIIYSNDRLVRFDASVSGSYINLYGQAYNANTNIKVFKVVIN